MSYKLRTIRSFDRDVKRLAKHYHSLRDDLRLLPGNYWKTHFKVQT